MTSTASVAARRLRREFVALQKEIQLGSFDGETPGEPSIAVAYDDIFEWHVRLSPQSGNYRGLTLHMVLNFAATPGGMGQHHDDARGYPHDPPQVTLSTNIPHSNIIPGHRGRDDNYLCLDLLKNFFFMSHGGGSGRRGEGWSVGYSVSALLLQIQTFLFDSHVLNYDGRYKHTLWDRVIEEGGGRRSKDEVCRRMYDSTRAALDFRCFMPCCADLVTPAMRTARPPGVLHGGDFVVSIVEEPQQETAIGGNEGRSQPQLLAARVLVLEVLNYGIDYGTQRLQVSPVPASALMGLVAESQPFVAVVQALRRAVEEGTDEARAAMLQAVGGEIGRLVTMKKTEVDTYSNTATLGVCHVSVLTREIDIFPTIFSDQLEMLSSCCVHEDVVDAGRRGYTSSVLLKFLGCPAQHFSLPNWHFLGAYEQALFPWLPIFRPRWACNMADVGAGRGGATSGTTHLPCWERPIEAPPRDATTEREQQTVYHFGAPHHNEDDGLDADELDADALRRQRALQKREESARIRAISYAGYVAEQASTSPSSQSGFDRDEPSSQPQAVAPASTARSDVVLCRGAADMAGFQVVRQTERGTSKLADIAQICGARATLGCRLPVVSSSSSTFGGGPDDMFLELPAEVVSEHVLPFLSLADLRSLGGTSRDFRGLCSMRASVYFDLPRLRCFYTLDGPDDIVESARDHLPDEDIAEGTTSTYGSLLGVGISLVKSQIPGQLDFRAVYDVLSYRAFYCLHVKTSIMGDKLHEWFPIAVDRRHFERSLPILMAQIEEFGCEDSQLAQRTRQDGSAARKARESVAQELTREALEVWGRETVGGTGGGSGGSSENRWFCPKFSEYMSYAEWVRWAGVVQKKRSYGADPSSSGDGSSVTDWAPRRDGTGINMASAVVHLPKAADIRLPSPVRMRPLPSSSPEVVGESSTDSNTTDGCNEDAKGVAVAVLGTTFLSTTERTGEMETAKKRSSFQERSVWHGWGVVGGADTIIPAVGGSPSPVTPSTTRSPSDSSCSSVAWDLDHQEPPSQRIGYFPALLSTVKPGKPQALSSWRAKPRSAVLASAGTSGPSSSAVLASVNKIQVPPRRVNTNPAVDLPQRLSRAVLSTLPRLMNSQLVQLMKGDVHASEKALAGYMGLQHTFLLLLERFPALQKAVDAAVHNFIYDCVPPGRVETPITGRSKAVCPNLGEFFCLPSVCGEFDWADVVLPVYEECCCRNAARVAREFPELSAPSAIVGGDAPAVLRKIFQQSLIGRQLLMFHCWFLRHVARPAHRHGAHDNMESSMGEKGMSVENKNNKPCPAVCTRPQCQLSVYERSKGIPPSYLVEQLQREVKEILAVDTWTGFFARIGVSVDSPPVLLKFFAACQNKCRQKGYLLDRRPTGKVGWRGKN